MPHYLLLNLLEWIKLIIKINDKALVLMKKIVINAYGPKRESHFFDLGNTHLNSLLNREPFQYTLESKIPFQNAIKNYNLALKRGDVRAYNQLGLVYATWAEKEAPNPKSQRRYFKLAKKAFSYAIDSNQETQAYFNLGIVNGHLASLNIELRVEHYEEAACNFKSAVEYGDQKAYGHLAIVYSILGLIHENIEKKYEYNLLAIENAKKAIADGWSGCYGTLGTAYLNLSYLSRDSKIKEQSYKQAIHYFQEAIKHGHDNFNSDLETSLYLLNDLMNKLKKLH